MEVICLEEKAFYSLVEEVVERLKEKHHIKHDKWISTERVMELMNVKSKTTLQNLRDTGAITFTQPQKKIILYDYDSIMDETIDEIYLKGFNHAYLIAKYNMMILEKTLIAPNEGPYFEGLVDGKESVKLEQRKTRFREIEKIQHRKDKNLDLEL